MRLLGFPDVGWTIAPWLYVVEAFQAAPGKLIAGAPDAKVSSGESEKFALRLFLTACAPSARKS